MRLLTWFLYFETGRVLLLPTPHVEPPALVNAWYEPATSEVKCKLAAEEMIDNLHLRAWCKESE